MNLQMFMSSSDLELETKYGIDRLELMLKFISVLKAEKTDVQYHKFKEWIESKINRILTIKEDINLMQGILDYVKSEEGSNERFVSMKYLFNLEYLIEPVCA